LAAVRNFGAIAVALAFLQAAPSQAENRNDRLEGLASACEDLVEIVWSDDAKAVRQKIGELKSQLAAAKSVLSSKAFAALSTRVDAVVAASNEGSASNLSLVTLDAFRDVLDAMHWPNRGVPKSVGLLDYAGFKLSVLARAPQPDWEVAAAIAREAHKYWSDVRKAINKGRALTDLGSTIEKGIDAAIAAHDREELAFAAQVQLDAADLLEQHFQRGK